MNTGYLFFHPKHCRAVGQPARHLDVYLLLEHRFHFGKLFVAFGYLLL
jgi:hypothetical protein